VGVVDTRWCIERISREVEFLLGFPVDHLSGVSLPSLLHPGDVPGLLTAAAHAHSYGVNAVARARLRRADRSLLWCRIRVAPLEQPPALAFVVSTLAEHAPRGEDQARDMELLLARIAREALSAGLPLPSPRVPNRTDRPEFSRLSDREWQVVFRLAEGQRVSSIAADLAVTPSTVRNHLSSVFGKLGVGSQAELLDVLQSTSSG
jgi:DNA-binding CsgD family transcriptional regulator